MIQPPPFLLAAALLFWGAVSDYLLVAAGMALSIEGPRLLPVRWELRARDFEWIADLCTLVFAALLVYLFVESRHLPGTLISVLVWLPMLFFALILAQRFSSAGQVPLSALFWSLRRRRRTADHPEKSVPLDYGYFCLCLLAASSSNPRTPGFFVGVCVLALYALWPAAPRPHQRAAWLSLAAASTALAFGIQAGLFALQTKLEEAAFEWLSEYWNGQRDPYQARTAIGDLGMLKTSDRIVMRVEAGGATVPRLRSAAYSLYAAGAWVAPDRSFAPMTPVGLSWQIADGQGPRVRISTWMTEGRALLGLPLGTYRLDGLNVAHAERNTMGAVRVAEGPHTLTFDAWYDLGMRIDPAPTTAETAVPGSLAPALDRVAQEIGLEGRSPKEAVRAVEAFFAAHFAYSLALESREGTARTLPRFLLEERRGHCEYFATATALLLRRAGIPTRYATGYSVQEFSPLEGQYIVRARHAHAWTLAWVDGRWVELDTTPAVWADEEAHAASPMQPLYDLASWLNYRFALWRSRERAESGPNVARLWLIAPLALYLGWRVYRRQRVRVGRNLRGPTSHAPAIADARLARILEQLARMGFTRPTTTPLLRWAAQLPLSDLAMRARIEEIVRSYYRARFDPNQLASDNLDELTEQADALVASLQAIERSTARG